MSPSPEPDRIEVREGREFKVFVLPDAGREEMLGREEDGPMEKWRFELRQDLDEAGLMKDASIGAVPRQGQ